MTISRRQLLATFATAAVGAASSSREAHAERAPSSLVPPRPLRNSNGDVDWHAVRDLFPLRPGAAHLACYYLTSHPRPVGEAIERYRRELDGDNLRAGAGAYQAIKRALAGYTGGAPAEFAITHNTTTGLAMAWMGLKIRAGQDVLTTTHDHYSHHESIRYSALRSGAEVRYVPLYDTGATADADQIVERVARNLRPATRAVGVTWVHSSTGVKLPVSRIAAVVARANRGRAEADRCLLIVDGVHGFGNQDVRLPDLGCDFLAAGTHKWLHAPRGTGMLWGRTDAWQHLYPTIPSFDPDGAGRTHQAWFARAPVPSTVAGMVSPGGFLAFEHFLAVPAAVGLHQSIGRANVAARIAELNGRVRLGLSCVPGVTLHTPMHPELSGGLTCFEVAGMSVGRARQQLAQRGFRTANSPYRPSYCRIAAGIMNTEDEVERVIGAVGGMP